MELVCPHCHQAAQFSGKRPAFCGYCGKLLPSAAEDPTVAADTAVADAGPGPSDDPSEIGGYRLLRVLGEGGMGRVYEAEQIAGGRRVALKLISARHVESPAAVERFRREGRLASSVAHPRCVFILAADESGGRPYIVMELMPGTTLQDLVERNGPLPVDRAIARILDVSAGLREIHRLGIVHRDVKPSNCLLDSQGNAKIGDFGLSRSLIRCDALTRTGTFIGTPLYASPEQIKGETVGPRSDVYSVAATLYYLLTGRAPFHGGDSAATLARIVSDPAPPMRSRRPELPAALDKAVLRGLERDPAKRWRNLDEFEAALLPFLPGRLSIGSLGLRFGAFLIDYFVLFLLNAPIALLTIAQTVDGNWQTNINPERQLMQMLVGLALWCLYFGGCEALWGCTPGKRWLGLRVCKANLGERPSVPAVLLRTGLLFFLLNLGALVLQAIMLAGAIDPSDPDPANQMRMGLLFAVAFYPALAIGIGALLCTMRARNGYRGLHEILSGTRVMRLPETAQRWALRGQGPELATLPPDGLPARIGPFEVTGIISEAGRGRLLAAQDASLGRRVWIWWRPADDRPQPPGRHDLGRASRLRWLAGGVDGHSQWDAFLAPEGGVLAGSASPDANTWGETRLLLGQLADELTAAQGDGTLPDTLCVGQIWIRPDGQAVLLDTAVGPAEFRANLPPLSLLARAATLALGARPRVDLVRPIAVGVPLPRYASAIVGRLVGIGESFKDVQEFQTALASAADKPAQTTRPRRLAHLALLAAAFSVAICGMGVTAAMPAILVVVTNFEIERMEAVGIRLAEVAELDKAATRDPDAARRQAALVNVPINAELATALAEATARLRQHRQARLEAMGWGTRKYAEAVEKQVAEQREKQKIDQMMLVPPASQPEFVRSTARSTASDRSDAVVFPMAVTQTVLVALWPMIWVVWAFLTRGGLGFLIMGLALVRRDGRAAMRTQCAWRALLVWAPVTGLAVAAVWLDAAFWSAWPGDGANRWMLTASVVAWWASVLLLPLYAALALINPQRSLHDRLAGTYLVPR